MPTLRGVIYQEAQILPLDAQKQLLAMAIRMLAARGAATEEQLSILEQLEERTSMEKGIQQFDFEGRQQIRVLEGRNSEPQFIATDVCKALGIVDTSDAVGRLDDDEKGTVKIPTPGGEQNVLTITESGLYTLIVRSNKPEARPFRKWVTSVVLPSIRKTGSYSIAQRPTSELDMIEAMVGWMRRKEAEDAERDQIDAEHEHRIMAMEARVTAIDEGSQYFTILAYARIRNIRIDSRMALEYGKKAARWSRANGYPIGQAPDTRFGTVGTYHIDALEAVFGKGSLS